MKTKATKDQATTGLVPKLRFPEFRSEEAWQTKPLNKLLFEPKKRNRDLELGPEDVLSVSGEYGCVNQIDFMGRSYAGASVKDYHVVEHGDVVYTKSPLKKNPFGIIKVNKGQRGIVSTLYAVYRPFPDCSGTYLDHFFSGDYNLNAYLQPLVKKGAKNDMKVNNADVLKGNVCVPKLPEQQKIADCLDSLDDLIAAQGCKVEALKTHKRGLMQQLFPREGETQPRLRFPEFLDTRQWDEYSLGAVCDLYQPVTLSSSELSMSGEHLVYGANGVIGTHNEYNHEESEIAVTCRGATCGEVTVTKPRSWITGNAMVVKPRSGILRKDFILQYFRNHGLKSVISGSAQPQITRTGFAPLAIFFPHPDEQERIASCLSSLDTLIAADTQTLDSLKTHKQGLMQQLFPFAEEAAA